MSVVTNCVTHKERWILSCADLSNTRAVHTCRRRAVCDIAHGTLYVYTSKYVYLVYSMDVQVGLNHDIYLRNVSHLQLLLTTCSSSTDSTVVIREVPTRLIDQSTETGVYVRTKAQRKVHSRQ